MKIVIASGKGGTGKTTVATGLARSCEGDVQLLDCDVEEPDCHLFLKPNIEGSEAVGIPIPTVNGSKCTGHGECGEICQYNAIVSLGGHPVVFPELCHGCGGCTLVCPEEAITEVPRQVGVVEYGHSGHIEFIQGRLRVGEAMSPPVMRAVKKYVREGATTIIDAPPGTSCPVVEAVKHTDFAVLVTEPTPFGLNDLTLAVEMLRKLRIPLGVVINRAGIGDDGVEAYCRTEGISILLRIPYDRRIAVAYSRGETLEVAIPEYREKLAGLATAIAAKVSS